MKAWISAARPRTLPLALACILMGSFLAANTGDFSWSIFGLAILTTILLQVLSNFANDYGDTQNGADSHERVGPQRAVQSGEITPTQMWKAIVITASLAFVAGLALLWTSFGSSYYKELLTFLAFGIASIFAAYFYTAGSKPYGYAGLGDISVLLFFGLLGVLGVAFLFQKEFHFSQILPALSCGFLATGVLNLNNIRDIDSDEKAGKITIPVRLGRVKSKVYHVVLLSSAMICMLLFAIVYEEMSLWYLLAFPLFVFNIIKLYKLPNPDPLLKQLALSTLVFVLLTGWSLLH
ncbi:1,4-dihydroxy-2-naphthoate prenyltransferase [Spirosomataceae bacterium TFI 002]|nr:1,4-dihydroxy-2-naphthoate prenyltransferase [Spirosomataceae bacterium TFI 002]